MLGTPGYLACLLRVFISATVADGWSVLIPLAGSMGLALLFYPRAMLEVLRPRVALFGIMLMIPGAFWMGPTDTRIFGIWVSSEGIGIAMAMLARAIAILIAVRGYVHSVSVGDMTVLLEKLGARGLGFALGVAFNSLPALERSASNAYMALRLRGGFRRDKLKSLRLLMTTILVGAIRRSEEIVVAAEARAFDPDTPIRRPIGTGRADVPVALVATAAIILLVLL